jgi:membrane protease YdiL (CAAX protease family)
VACFPVAAGAQLLQPGLGLVWAQLALFALPATLLPARAGLRAAPFLALRAPPPRTLGLALLVGLAAMLVGGALQALWTLVLPGALLQAFDVSRLFRRPPWEQALLVAAATALAPVCEELAFRGHLLSALRQRHGTRAAIALSTLAFAGLHLDPVRLPGLLFLGLLYGWLTVRAGSVYPAMLAHAVNNVAATALAISEPAGGAAEAIEPGPALAALAFGLLLLAPPLVALDRWLPPAPDSSAAIEVGEEAPGRTPRWGWTALAAALLGLAGIALLPRR